MDDERWETLRAAVADAFGGSLAVAAARGRLTAADLPRPSASREAPGDEEDQVATLTLHVPAHPPTAGPTPLVQGVADPRSPLTSNGSTSARAVTGATDEALWQALARGMPALGYQLATYAPDLAVSAGVPSWLLRALTLSGWLRYPNGDLALALQADLAPGLAAQASGERAQALLLLYVAAALRPALIAPETGAWSLLRSLVGQLPWPHLERLVSTVAEHGEGHRPLTPLPIQPLSSVQAWRDAMEDLLRDIGGWRLRMLGMDISFAPASAVWRSWMQPDGLVHGLIASLGLEPYPLEQTLGRIERLSNTPQIRWEISATDRETLGRSQGPAIASRPEALMELVEGVNQAVAFARAWAALQEVRPGREDDPSRREAAEFRGTLSALLEPAREEIVRARQEQTAIALRTGLDRVAAALDSVAGLLGAPERSVSWPPRELSPAMLLNAPLLREPTTLLDANWNVESVPVDVAERLAELAETGSLDWSQAFAARLRRGDHQATGQILTLLEAGIEVEPGVDVGALRARREADLARWQDQLGTEIERSRDAIDLAAASGRLGDAERGCLQAVVESVHAQPVLAQQRSGFALDRLTEVRRALEGPSDRPTPANRPDARSRVALTAEFAAGDGPCLLVGRPGLGRRAFLDDLARSCSRDDRQVVLFEVRREPAIDVAVERFWIGLQGALSSQLGLESRTTPSGASAVRQLLEAWLAADARRRVLILVDEGDALLEAERRIALGGSTDRFPISRSLTALMDGVEGRVKVVLAGWLEVQRATRLADHPLAVRGCRWLGPMLDDGEWQQAGVLAHDLLTRANLPAASPAQLARVLSLANYEPEALARVIDVVGQQVRESDADGLVLERVRGNRLLGEARTSDTRHAVLADRRFDVVLALVALGCRGGTASISREHLRRQAIDWWAEGFRETWTDDAFRDLIDDLVGLRLLRPIDQGKLALHSPNLLSELGTADELIAELSDYVGRPASLDVELDPRRDERRPCPSAPPGLAVLTARQRAMLNRSHARVSVVFGTDAAGLASVSSCLDDGSRRIAMLDLHDRSEEEGLSDRIAARLRDAPTEPTWLVLTGSWPARADILSLLQDALGPHPTAGVILLSSPEQTWQSIRTLADTSEATLAEWLEAAGVDTYSLGPWPMSVLNG